MSKIDFKPTSEPDAIRVSNIESKRVILEKQSPATKAGASEDQLKLSDRAATIGKLVDKLNQVPEVRIDKVDALREKIAAGEYKPEAEDIARAILQDEK